MPRSHPLFSADLAVLWDPQFQFYNFQTILFPAMSKEKLGLVLESYQYYKQFSDYCSNHPEDEAFVQVEHPLCEEMVKLLPVKILRMKQDLGIE